MTPVLQRCLLSLLALLALPQCKPKPSPTEEPPAASSQKARSTPAADATIIGISFDQRRQELRNVQFDLIHRMVSSRPKTQLIDANADQDAELQLSHLHRFIEKGVKFLIVFPVDPTLLYPTLLQAEQDGIEVIVLNAPPDEALPAGLSFVHTNQYLLGKIAGKLVGEALIKKHQHDGAEATWGKVVQLRGDEARESAERARGFRNALQALVPQALVHDAPTEWNPTLVPQRLSEAYRIHPQFDVIYAHDDRLAHAAHQWVRSSDNKLRRNQMLLCGTDGYPGDNAGQAFLQQNVIDYSIFHPPLVDVAWSLILGRLKAPNTPLEGSKEAVPFLITPQKLEELLEVGLPAPHLK